MRSVERIMLFLLLLLASGFEQGFLAEPTVGGSSEGQPGIQVLFGLMYLVLFLFLIRKYRKTALFLIQKEKWTFLICCWVLASALWSVEPGATIRRSIALVGTSLAGLYIGIRFEPKQQLKMITLVIGLGAIASLVAGLLFPSIGVTSDGFWGGIYHNKNTLGRMMALGAVCFSILALGQRRLRVGRIAMVVLCCVLLWLSKSATAVVVCLLMFAILPLRKVLFLRTRSLAAAMVAGGVAMTAIVIFTVNYVDQILDALGRTSSLTGRIPLWQFVISDIGDKPILGYGFSAFWDSWEGQRVSDAVAWDVAVPHAHNGFLEMWLGIGLIGLALVIISLARNFLFAVRAARAHREIDQAWPLLLLAFTLLYNLTESSLLGINSILWIAFIANSFWLVRTAEEEKYAEVPQEFPEHAYSS